MRLPAADQAPDGEGHIRPPRVTDDDIRRIYQIQRDGGTQAAARRATGHAAATIAKYWYAMDRVRNLPGCREQIRRTAGNSKGKVTRTLPGLQERDGVANAYGVTDAALRRVLRIVEECEAQGQREEATAGGPVAFGPARAPSAHETQLLAWASDLAERLPPLETPFEAAERYGAQRPAGAALDPEEFLLGMGSPMDGLLREEGARRLRAHLPGHALWTRCEEIGKARRVFLLAVRDAWEEQCAQAAERTALALLRPRVRNTLEDATAHLPSDGLAPGFIDTVLAAGSAPHVALAAGVPSWRGVGYRMAGAIFGDGAADASVMPDGDPLAAAFAGAPEAETGATSGEVWAVPADLLPAVPGNAARNAGRLGDAHAAPGTLIGRLDGPQGQDRLVRAHEEQARAFRSSPRAKALAGRYTDAAHVLEEMRQALRALLPAEFQVGPCDLCPPP